jgi:hypothetical protein
MICIVGRRYVNSSLGIRNWTFSQSTDSLSRMERTRLASSRVGACILQMGSAIQLTLHRSSLASTSCLQFDTNAAQAFQFLRERMVDRYSLLDDYVCIVFSTGEAARNAIVQFNRKCLKYNNRILIVQRSFHVREVLNPNGTCKIFRRC